jgi:hypothetical protein
MTEIEARKRCPACKQFLPGHSPFRGVDLNATERRLVSIVRRAGEQGIYIDELTDAMYAHDPGGSPDTGKRVIYVTICRLNKKLAGAGWIVRGGGKGRGIATPYVVKRLANGFTCASS